MDDKDRAQAFKTSRIHAWPGLSVDSSDLGGNNLLSATGDGRYAVLVWSGRDCSVGSVPIGAADIFRDIAPPRSPNAVRRCVAHQITDCFDCKNPVQSTQENPQFEWVEVTNGHE